MMIPIKYLLIPVIKEPRIILLVDLVRAGFQIMYVYL